MKKPLAPIFVCSAALLLGCDGTKSSLAPNESTPSPENFASAVSIVSPLDTSAASYIQVASMAQLESTLGAQGTHAVNANRVVVNSSGEPVSVAGRTTTQVVQSYETTSGRMHVASWRCDIYGQYNSLTCTVPDGYVRIGGGAWADYGSGQGALLWASAPIGDDGWIGGSKDHRYPNPHTLYVYVIGLRIDGFTVDQLKAQMFNAWNWTVPAPSSRPISVVSLPAEYTLLSGGAWFTKVTGDNVLMSFSFPDTAKEYAPNYDYSTPALIPTGNKWRASGKDHLNPGTAYAHASIVGIRSSFPDPWNPGFNFQISSELRMRSAVNTVYGGVATASQQLPGRLISGYAGGVAMDYFNERIMYKIGPTGGRTQGGTIAEAASKDHGIVSRGGSTWVGQIEFWNGPMRQ